MATIDKLTEIDVRSLWQHEQYDFSNWLAKEENIEDLGKILGLSLIDVQKEAYIGTYRCDLTAKDEMTNVRVIIENQLETTDHDHLGKIITYASGMDAKFIVWIVKEAREEHRAAIEWLNNNTIDGINFFLIEIHAYKIGNSNPAAKFEIIEKPNDFVKRGKSKGEDGELTRSQAEFLLFWEKFNQVLAEKGKPFNIRMATAHHWYDIALGTSKAHVTINLVNKEGKIVVAVHIENNKDLFDNLLEKKDEIEEKLGFPMIWDRMDDKKRSRIKYEIKGLDFEDHSNYEELMNKTIDTAVRIRNVFKRYI